MFRLKFSEDVKFRIVAGMTLLSNGFWAFQLIPDGLGKMFGFTVLGAIILFVLWNTRVFLKPGLKFKTNVLLFFCLPVLGIFGAYIYHDQDFSLSLLLFRDNFVWFFYFLLHIFNLPKERIVKFMVFVGCVWAFLTVVQQFTYPHAYFYTRGEGNASLHRAGVLRFGVPGQQYGAFALLWSFYYYLTTKNRQLLWIVGLTLIGFYYYGSRQLLVSVMGCMGIALFMMKGIGKWGYLFLGLVLGVLVVTVLKPTMLEHMIEMTSEQVNNDDYIRFLAGRFFLFEYWPPGLLPKLLGNGEAHDLSPYGVEMNYIKSVLSYFRADVGIIGVYNTYGLVYILNIVLVSLKGLFLKIPSDKDKYVKLLIYYATVLLPINVSYHHGGGMIFFSFVFYLADKAFEKKEEKEIVSQQPLSEKQLVPATI